jgi:hypothetical protein
LVTFVVFYMKGDSGAFDDLPSYPTNALQAQDLVGIVTK